MERLIFKVTRSAFFTILLFAGLPAFSQVLERTQTNSGTNTSFTYSITSSYGATTSADASPNLIVNTEAILNLKEDSVITNTAGSIGGSTGAVIETTPNGTNVNLTGIEANNKFLIDEGTSFKASLTTSEPDGNPSNGNATAQAFHTLTLTVTNNNTSFINTLRENFEGAL